MSVNTNEITGSGRDISPLLSKLVERARGLYTPIPQSVRFEPSNLEQNRKTYFDSLARLDLGNVSTSEEYRQHLDQIVDQFALLPDEQLFEKLQQLDLACDAYQEVCKASRLYLRLERARTTLGIREDLSPEKLNDQQLVALFNKLRDTEVDGNANGLYSINPHHQNIVGEALKRDGNTPLFEEIELDPVLQTADGYANFKGGHILVKMTEDLLEKFTRRFGYDSVDHQPVLRFGWLKTYERYSDMVLSTKPLPDFLDRWVRDGLIDPNPHIDTRHRAKTLEHMKSLVSMVLPQGEEDEDFRNFEQIAPEFEKLEAAFSPHNLNYLYTEINMPVPGETYFAMRPETHPEEYQRLNELRPMRDSVLLSIRRKLFAEIVTKMETMNERYHPRAEDAVLNLLVETAWSENNTYREGLPIFNLFIGAYPNVPLSELVLNSKRIGLKAGVWIDPLKDEIRSRVLSAGMDPQTLIDKIREEMRVRSWARNYSSDPPHTENPSEWIVQQAAYVACSLDDNGSFVEDYPIDAHGADRYALPPRETVVVEDIIEFIEGLIQ